jgi:hypothetical protein
MPYEIRKEDDKFCVYNSDTDKKKGCSDTKKEAAAFMRKLYSVDNADKKEVEQMVYKAFDDFYAVNPEERPETEDEEKSIYGTVAYTWATSYAQLDEETDARETAIETSDLLSSFPMLAENIIIDSDITNKKTAIKKLGGELADRIEAADKSSKESDRASRINEALTKLKNFISPPKDDNKSMMLWKEADGTYRWITRYSNKFRDQDNPPEIISEKSHRRFIEMVDKGQAPYPELWLWHVPDWRIGQADWLAYDDVGFALSSGTIDKGKEPVAEWLMKQEDFLVSHGMPNDSIARDTEDPTVIIEHETREISLLPGDVAANTMTGFVINKESDMTIPEEKRAALVGKWKLSEGLLDGLEAANSEEAEQAIEEGVESKEKEAETDVDVEAEVEVEEDETKDETEEDTTDEEPEAADNPLTRKEVADAIQAVFTPILEKIDERTETLEKAVVQILKSDEKKIKETISNTPAASLAVLLQKGIVGDDDALVKEGDEVDGLSPEENEEEVEPVLGIPFIDRMLQPKE